MYRGEDELIFIHGEEILRISGYNFIPIPNLTFLTAENIRRRGDTREISRVFQV